MRNIIALAVIITGLKSIKKIRKLNIQLPYKIMPSHYLALKR